MIKTTIYRKSARGTEAMASRQSGLAPRLRSLLIMVDGKRTHDELVDIGAALGDPDRLLQLIADELVEPLDGFPAAAAMPAAQGGVDPPQPVTSASAATELAWSLAQAQRYASHLLEDAVGPGAQSLCIKLESAKDLAEFVSAVKRGRDLVRDMKGGAAAERFIAQIEARMPAS